jgi:hypothetical protein
MDMRNERDYAIPRATMPQMALPGRDLVPIFMSDSS